jgi:hypothetical protein
MSSEDALRRSIVRSSLKQSHQLTAPQRKSGLSMMDAAALIIGGLLACEGIRTRRGWIPMGLGLAVFYQGLCGLTGDGSCGFGMLSDVEQPDEKIASNPVDEAAWESFPASDPPTTFTPQKI